MGSELWSTTSMWPAGTAMLQLWSSGGQHALTQISMTCTLPSEAWQAHFPVYWNRFSLRVLQVGSLPGDLSLPSQRSLNRLDPQFIDSRRAGLQHYLDIATSEEFFTAHPPAVAQLILFLTGDVYKHSSGEISRIVRLFSCERG